MRNTLLTTGSFIACSLSLAAVLLLSTTSCDSGTSTRVGPGQEAGDGFLAVENITARDFTVTLTGASFTTTNETTAAGSTPNLVTNITTAADGVTMVTNVVNTPTATTVTNLMVEVVTPDPIVRDAPDRLTSVFPIPANTYRAVFEVKGGIRIGETSVIIREDQRTRVSVLLEPDTDTGLQLSVSN